MKKRHNSRAVHKELNFQQGEKQDVWSFNATVGRGNEALSKALDLSSSPISRSQDLPMVTSLGKE